MRRTFITILISVLVTSLCWYVVGSLRRGVAGLWLMSAVKAPGRMALDEIEADLQAGRIEIAKSKIAAFRKQWVVFESEHGFRGQAIGDIMVRFRRMDSATDTNKIAEPSGAVPRVGGPLPNPLPHPFAVSQRVPPLHELLRVQLFAQIR
jgi:hypothetical protein